MPGERPRWSARGGTEGQSSVEFALVLPLFVLVMLSIVQVGIVVRDQVVLTNAAHEAARAAAMSPDVDAPRLAAIAAGGLEPTRLDVRITGRDGPGSLVRAHLDYSSATDLPMIGRLVHGVRLSADAAVAQSP